MEHTKTDTQRLSLAQLPALLLESSFGILCKSSSEQLGLQLRRQVHEAHGESVKEGVKMDANYLAKKLHLPGYLFAVRLALGGSDGGSCLQQLRHFFLTCSASGISHYILGKDLPP